MGKDASFPDVLWDLLPTRELAAHGGGTGLAPSTQRPIARPIAPAPVPSINGNVRGVDEAAPARAAIRSARYARLVRQMKREHRIRVTKWRTRNTGCAWQVEYADGTVSRLIEAPYPKGPISCAVFLHEVGHHAIGFYRYKPRCYEEYMAWRWSLAAMREHGFTVTPAVHRLVDQAMRYAVAKAMRRRIKRIPSELRPWLPARVREARLNVRV